MVATARLKNIQNQLNPDMNSHAILLKNGTVLIHGEDDRVTPTKADLLVQGNKIARIGNIVDVPTNAEVVDCTDKIVAPGFVDTHRHMYNIGLRGRHGDSLLEDYIVEAILQASNFSPEDVYWGQLAGCLEAINAGTTTVVDHSHLNYSRDHPRAAIEATVTSGLRSIYGYCFNVRLQSWSPFAFDQPLLAPWTIDALKELASLGSIGDGRVTLGIAYDGWFMPNEVNMDLFKTVNELGIKHLTTHNSAPKPGTSSNIQKMDDCGVLTPLTILAHANGMTESDAALVRKRHAHVSSTPSVELQMGMGHPLCFDPTQPLLHDLASVGIDCHNVTLASMPAELRTGLQCSRGRHHAALLAQGKKAARVHATVAQAYAVGTIGGARAVGMEALVGSLVEGKLADVLVFDALSPNMVCGAQRDPVGAIVLHSTPADIVMTIVDGRVRKRDGRLVPVETGAGATPLWEVEKSVLRWEDVARRVLRSRESLDAKIDKVDLKAAKRDAMRAFGYDPEMIAETV